MITASEDTTKIKQILTDEPLKNPQDDFFGYAKFAEHLADAICKVETPECLIFAVCGPWGAGKTTVLNFVQYYLKQKSEGQKFTIINFNPWWFSGEEALLHQFFEEIKIGFEGKSSLKGLAKPVSELADKLVPQPWGKILSVVIQHVASEKSIYEIREKIIQELLQANERFLIIIDDIDRLSTKEIRSLFKVIKAVANFPNTIYLLAFDKTVVANALEDAQKGISGEDYLEKIVQVSLELPAFEKIYLRRFLFEQLNLILEDTPEELFDQTYWGNIYWAGIDHFINTMRDVKRLLNALKLTYPRVKGEVNPIDFIAIESVRIFCPDVYFLIRNNPEKFAGSLSDFIRSEREELKVFHEGWLKQVPEKCGRFLKDMLKKLFPKLDSVLKGIAYGSDWESEWRKHLRICSPDIFPTYFQLSVPSGSISYLEMKTFLSHVSEKERFTKILLDLSQIKFPDGSLKVSVFLERMLDYADDIPIEHIPNILDVLFDIGDDLLLAEDEKFIISMSIDNNVRIGWIVFKLLERLNSSQKRFEVLKKAFLQGKAVSTIVDKVVVLGQQHGKYTTKKPSPSEEKLINIEHLAELEKIALEKIKMAVQKGELLHKPNLPLILHYWRDWEGENVVKKWIEKVIETDKGLVVLLTAFLNKARRGEGDYVARENWHLDPRAVEPFLDLNVTYQRCKNLLQTPSAWLKDNEKTAVETFIKNMKKQINKENKPHADLH